MIGGFGFIFFLIFSLISRELGQETLSQIFLWSSLLVAFIGILFHEQIAAFVGDRVAASFTILSTVYGKSEGTEGRSYR